MRHQFQRITFLPILCSLLFAGCRSNNGAANPTDRKANAKDSTPVAITQNQPGVVAATDSTCALGFLVKWNGRYPYQVGLLDNPVIKTRLKKMLGEKYVFLKKIWQVETPIEINDHLFYAWAMQTHSGGDPGAVLMADLPKNILYVGIRNNGHTTLYSENGSAAPKKLQDWSREN